MNKEEIRKQRDSILSGIFKNGVKLGDAICDNMSENIGIHTTIFLKVELNEYVQNENFEMAENN